MRSKKPASRSKDQQSGRRIAMYCRVAKQDLLVMGTRRERQMKVMCKFLDNMKQSDGFEVASVDTFIDVDRAKKSSRHALMRLLRAVSQGDIDTVLAASMNTIAEDAFSFVKIAGFLKAHGVQLITVAQKLDTGTPPGRALVTMIAKVVKLIGGCGQE